MKKTFTFLICAFVGLNAYAQNFTNPGCTSLTPEELNKGFNEGKAYGKESLGAAASYYGIQAVTVSNPLPGVTYETVQSGVFDSSGNWVNNSGTGTATLGSHVVYPDPYGLIPNWPQLQLIRENILQGPYCPLFNDVRLNGFDAGYSGAQ